jgi:hypothetical protein
VAALVLDAGALIALDRGDRQTAAILAAAALDGMNVITSSACTAQAWRSPARQARLARALEGCAERALDAVQAKRCGMALARSETNDIPDVALCVAVCDGDRVLTSDPSDIERLLDVLGTRAVVRRV